MAKIDGGEILVQCLLAENIQTFFAIADISYAPVLRSAETHGCKIVGGRHESAGVHMADAWARVTGSPAVVMGSMGPSVANLTPGVITAWIEGIPVLVVVTQRVDKVHRSIRRGKFQYTPQQEIFKPVTKWAGVVPDAARIPEYVREACRIMLTGRLGPVYLEIEDTIYRQKVDTSQLNIVPASRYRTLPTPPDPDRVEEAAKMIHASSFPLIVAGDGVARSGAENALAELAQHTGALVMTSMGARGVFDEKNAQSVMYNTKGGKKAALEADLVLAIGTPVGEMLGFGTPPQWADANSQKWIQIDSDPEMMGVNRDLDLAIVGDAKAGVARIVEALRRLSSAKEVSAKAKQCVDAYVRERAEVADKLADTDAMPIHPARLAREVAEFFPDDAIACFDGGNTTVWSHIFHRFQRPRSFLWTSHFGHLGTGLPYAVGAKLAAPNRPVYLITGDGAFGFNLQELETAARMRANIVVVISCDFNWGMEHLAMAVEIGSTVGVPTSAVRYDLVAKGLGCHGEFVEQPDQIQPALKRASAAGRPAVVQVIIDRDANVNPPGLMELGRMYAGQDSQWDVEWPIVKGFAKYQIGKLLQKNPPAHPSLPEGGEGESE